MTPERKDRTRFRSREIRMLFGLLLLGVGLGVAGAIYWKTRANDALSNIFVTGTVTLVFGALLGGVVSLLIADFDRRRVQRAAQLEFISNILNELKAVYDRVDRGRTLIAAHQSAKTYGEQMREFIDARVKLLAVERALRFDERRSVISAVMVDVEKMETYLHLLTKEFIEHYKHISRAQSIYEAEMKKGLEESPPTLPDNLPWNELAKLETLQGFLRPTESNYSLDFIQSLDNASEKLRKALEAELT
jgi:hypothetical protein